MRDARHRDVLRGAHLTQNLHRVAHERFGAQLLGHPGMEMAVGEQRYHKAYGPDADGRHHVCGDDQQYQPRERKDLTQPSRPV